MFENPRRGRQARNFTTNVPKILDLKLSSEQRHSENCRWVPLSFPCMNRNFVIFQDKIYTKLFFLVNKPTNCGHTVLLIHIIWHVNAFEMEVKNYCAFMYFHLIRLLSFALLFKRTVSRFWGTKRHLPDFSWRTQFEPIGSSSFIFPSLVLEHVYAGFFTREDHETERELKT